MQRQEQTASSTNNNNISISRRGGDWSKSKASSYKRQKQQLDGKGWIQHVELQVRELLLECGLQEILRKNVMAQVDDILLTQQGSGNADLDKMRTNGTMEDICSFKCTKFSKPQKLNSTGPQLVSLDITLSSMVCPALHGKSKGRIDRLASGQQIVEALRKLQFANRQNGLFIKTVDLHGKSGHINVIVDATFEDVMMQVSSPGIIREQTAVKKEAVDVIAEYIKSTSILSKSEQDALSPPYRLSVRSISSDVSGCMPQVHRLHCKYQQAIHGDEDPYVGAATNMAAMDEKLPVDSTVSEPSEDEGSDDDEHVQMITEENFAALYPQYDNTQIKKIHKSYNSFHRFLCASPLPNNTLTIVASTSKSATTSTADGNESEPNSSLFGIKDQDVIIPYGSYHQHYLINDKYLIAVGVVDILPHCLSSVYSFYDPKLSNILNLGKITALYEIQWVKRALEIRPNLKYYYLGYYIHSCQKMRYKAEYKPSELLCPARGQWTDFEEAKVRLEARSPIRHCCNVSTPDDEYFEMMKDAKGNASKNSEEAKTNAVVNDILFDIGTGTYLTIAMITDEAQDIVRPLLQDFVKETGNDVARHCIVKLCG
jgi:arginine-tRNA-protein transferase